MSSNEFWALIREEYPWLWNKESIVTLPVTGAYLFSCVLALFKV